MAILERISQGSNSVSVSGAHTGPRRKVLEVETRIGRAGDCQLHIGEAFVSSLHATIRWRGNGWVIKDLGSRNGTYVEGKLLEPRVDYEIRQAAKVRFGSVEEEWVLSDEAPPIAMAIFYDSGYERYVFPESGILALPSADHPIASIYRGALGDWVIEYPHESLLIRHGQIVDVAGMHFRFCSPDILAGTAVMEGNSKDLSAYAERKIADASLKFRVSMDEEHVELSCGVDEEEIPMRSRSHFYLLLTLARYRQEDAEAGVAESSAGWRYTEDICKSLRIPVEQLNVQIFRIRRDFGRAGFGDSAEIVERRPQSKQLRVGVDSSRIVIDTV